MLSNHSDEQANAELAEADITEPWKMEGKVKLGEIIKHIALL